MGKKHTMRKFMGQVKNLVEQSDVVLEVVDARDIGGTRNRSLEKFAGRGRKKIVIVVNKTDLIDKKPDVSDIPYEIIFISCKKRKGKQGIFDAITRSGKKNIKVVVVGYPDIGKSSLINWLKGKKVVKVEFTSGSTKGPQFIRINPQILMIDTPGVIQRRESISSLVLKTALSPEKVKDPELVAYEIIKKSLIKGNLFNYYNIPKSKDPETVLEMIAERRNLLVKGGEPNLIEAAKILIRDYQKGNVRF